MHKNTPLDAIDLFVEEWIQVRPDLDFNYLETVGRILRVSAHLREAMDTWLEPFGITWEMFDLLASLQRSASANGMRPTDLYGVCMLSSGATTNRIDRAEKLNYAVRRPDPSDGRATRIALTKKGAGLAQKAMTKHSRCAGEVSKRLTAAEQKKLAELLRKLLLSFEADKNITRQPKRKAASASKNGSSAEWPQP